MSKNAFLQEQQLFKEGKSYPDMDDYEVRSYTGCHRCFLQIIIAATLEGKTQRQLFDIKLDNLPIFAGIHFVPVYNLCI